MGRWSINGRNIGGHKMITTKDIIDVADLIGVTLTEDEINWVLLSYEDAQRQDPSGTWNLVVEDLIYQAIEFRGKDEDDESEETRRDFGNDDDDVNLSIGEQIV
jgi:hypothetical protein